MPKQLSSFRNWVHGLGATVIGGVASAISVSIAAPELFSWKDGWNRLIGVAVVSGLVNAAMYLKQSPLPAMEEEVIQTPAVTTVTDVPK